MYIYGPFAKERIHIFWIPSSNFGLSLIIAQIVLSNYSEFRDSVFVSSYWLNRERYCSGDGGDDSCGGQLETVLVSPRASSVFLQQELQHARAPATQAN